MLQLPRWLGGKESTRKYRKCEFNPWIKTYPGGGNGNPLHYSCLVLHLYSCTANRQIPWTEKPIRARVHRVAKESDTT